MLPTGFRRHFIAGEEGLEADPAGSQGGERAPSGEPHLLVPVTSYAHLPPRQRPAAHCPVCLQRVWMKLGTRMRHHFAHRTGSVCSLARGEGALHLAAKLHLAAVLAQAPALTLEHLCHGARTDRSREPCRRRFRTDLPWRWDEVRVEVSLAGVRSDVLLVEGGRPVAAVEVFSTSAVHPERARRYEGLGVPWIEVPAAEVVGPGRAWKPTDPLPVIGDSSREVVRWRCARHERLHAAWLHEQRNGEHPIAWRLVHIYRADSGLRASERKVRPVVCTMVEQRRDGLPIAARLVRDDTGVEIGRTRGNERDQLRAALHQEFTRWVRWMREQQAVVDSPMRWITTSNTTESPPPQHFPQRLRWDHHAAAFIPPPNLPRLAWPRMQAEPGDPDGILGQTPCFWTDLPVRDRSQQLNSILGSTWILIAPISWEVGGTMWTRASISVHHHDGGEWREISTGHTPDLPTVDGVLTWHDHLAGIADVLYRSAAAGGGAVADPGTAVAESLKRWQRAPEPAPEPEPEP